MSHFKGRRAWRQAAHADLAAARGTPGVKQVVQIKGAGGFDGTVDGVAILANGA